MTAHRIASVSYTVEFIIGHHNCTACVAPTPEPSQAVLDQLAKDGHSSKFVWPFEHWMPPGWMRMESGHICDRCARAVMALLSSRKGQESPLDNDDLVILEDSVQRAVALANEALLTTFPPQPIATDDGDYRYSHPSINAHYRTYDEYRTGTLRQRIREIRDTLCAVRVEKDE